MSICSIRWANLGIQIIDSLHGILDIPGLYGVANIHAVLDGGKVDVGRKRRFLAELFRSVLVALDNQIVHDECVEVTVFRSSIFQWYHEDVRKW